jgi:hypothetical protein
MAVPKAYTKFRNQLISELTRFPEYIGSRSCGVPMLSNCVVDFLISNLVSDIRDFYRDGPHDF